MGESGFPALGAVGYQLKRMLEKKRGFKLVACGVVLAICVSLRVIGLSWGLEKGYQPDEVSSMLGVADLDFVNGDLDAPATYFEGTLSYYVWSVPVAAMKLLEQPAGQTWRANDSKHWRRVLLTSRILTAIFDLITVVLVFLTAWEATAAFFPALFAGFLYGIIPMELIYAHFMRPHVLANLGCALVIYLSFKLAKSHPWWLCLGAGLAAGLATTARYTMGVTLAIPCLCLLCSVDQSQMRFTERIRKAFRLLFAGPIWWIIVGFIAGVFVGEPPLFVDLPRVMEEIAKRTLPFVPPDHFKGAQLMNLSALGKYLFSLIPYAMWPLLWTVPYLAAGYLLIRRRWLGYVGPILIFSLLYLYPMAKGYYLGVFARAVMPLFPGFCILSGLALYEFLAQTKARLGLRYCVVALLACVVALTLIFDYAYVSAMQREDPRTRLRRDLRTAIGDAQATIGIRKSGGYFYTLYPATNPLKSKSVSVEFQPADGSADYYLVGFMTPLSPGGERKTVGQVEEARRFKFVRSYGKELRIGGFKVDMSKFPTDMTYPFCEILLFRARSGSP